MMKSRVKLYGIVLITFFIWPLIGIFGQEASSLRVNPNDPEFRAQFDKLDFNGRMAVLATSDVTNNYFMADFSQFSDKFEKVWFLNLVFRSDNIVNIDPGIDRDRVWFLARKSVEEPKILDEFDRFKEMTRKESLRMTETEKADWMKTNDKYK